MSAQVSTSPQHPKYRKDGRIEALLIHYALNLTEAENANTPEMAHAIARLLEAIATIYSPLVKVYE